MTNDATCLQCGDTSLFTRATYDQFVAAAKDAPDERKKIYDYMQQQAIAPFKEFTACRACGFTRVLPAPTTAMLMQFYQGYYANSAYAKKQESKIRRTKKRLHSLRKHVAGGTFLDVGCNVGFAVEAARQSGFTATGIEIDAKSTAYAAEHFPGNTFVATTIEDYTPGTTYDLVYCTEVIEHVIDPVTFAAHLARLTKPGGYLFLTTPDVGHWRVPADFVSWPEVKPLEHINWQTKKSMTQLLMAQGFEKPRFSFNFKPGLKVLARRKA